MVRSLHLYEQIPSGFTQSQEGRRRPEHPNNLMLAKEKPTIAVFRLMSQSILTERAADPYCLPRHQMSPWTLPGDRDLIWPFGSAQAACTDNRFDTIEPCCKFAANTAR